MDNPEEFESEEEDLVTPGTSKSWPLAYRRWRWQEGWAGWDEEHETMPESSWM
jgi:hypothetical protein